MTVIVGSARIDENKHAKGGKAGDQTGKEISTQTWYLHSKEKPVINFDQIMVIGKSVFVRKQPDKLSLAIGIAYCGDCFPYRGETDKWFEIIYKDKIAYITKKYTILTNSE